RRRPAASQAHRHSAAGSASIPRRWPAASTAAIKPQRRRLPRSELQGQRRSADRAEIYPFEPTLLPVRSYHHAVACTCRRSWLRWLSPLRSAFLELELVPLLRPCSFDGTGRQFENRMREQAPRHPPRRDLAHRLPYPALPVQIKNVNGEF